MEKTKTNGLIDEFTSFVKHTGSGTKRVLEILIEEFDLFIEDTGKEKEKVKGGEFITFVEAVTSHAIHEICDISSRSTEEVLMEMVQKEKKLNRMMDALYE